MVYGMECLSSYRNGNYNVVLLDNGTKIRYNREDYFEPEFAESMDVTITKYCDNECPYCYMGCSREGKHGDILNKKFLDSIPDGVEIAINGNDLSHPDLTEFLIRMKNKGVIVNMTVSQEHFMKHYPIIRGFYDSSLIHGLGISYHSCDIGMLSKARPMKNTVFHIVLGVVPYRDLVELRGYTDKILILGYKPVGRGKDYLIKSDLSVIHDRIAEYDTNLKNIHDMFHTVSYDNLAIGQLGLESRVDKVDWEKYFLGKDGEFSFYVDLVDGTFAKSSFDGEKYSLSDYNYDVVRAFRKIHDSVA